MPLTGDKMKTPTTFFLVAFLFVAISSVCIGARAIVTVPKEQAEKELGVRIQSAPVVEGSLPGTNWVGGVAVAEISKNDGRILSVSHGQ